MVSEAEVDGTRLTVTLNEEIDPCCKGRWRVRADGVFQSVPDAETTVAGNALTLTLGARGRCRPAGRLRLCRRRGRRAGRAGQPPRAVLHVHGRDQRHGAPEPVSAKVNGTKLTLAFDEPLDGGSVPAPGDFGVTAGGAPHGVAAGGGRHRRRERDAHPGIGGRGASGRSGWATARARPPLRDRGGNEVAGFSDQTVTNVRPPALPERAGDREDAHPALR